MYDKYRNVVFGVRIMAEYNTLEEIRTVLDDEEKKKNLSPADLWELRQKLTAFSQESGAETTAKKLEDVIVAKAQELAENKTVMLDMNQAYVLRDMLQEIAAHPLSDNKETNAPVIKSAQEILKDHIDTFEEHYGIKQPILDEAVVMRNIDTLGNMPVYTELLSYNEPYFKPVPAIELTDIRGAVNDAARKGELLSVETLAGVFQDKSLDLPQFDTDRKILLDMALKHIKKIDAAKLKPEELANYAQLLRKLRYSDEYKDKKTAALFQEKLNDFVVARKNAHNINNLKYPEFASVVSVLDNIKVEDGFTLTGRKQTDQTEQDSDINIFKDRIFDETRLFLAYTSKEEITEEVLRETYNERLKLGIVEIVYADRISKGEIDKKNTEQMLKLFDGLSDEAKAGKTFKINRATLAGWQATHDNLNKTAATRAEVAGHKQSSKTFFSRIKDLDTKCTKKYPTLYPLVRNGFKSAGWGSAYGIGSMFGPAGVAAVATASFAWTGYRFFNSFRKARAVAKEKGEKLGFWKYLKYNKLQAASMLLSASSAAFGFGGWAGLESMANGSALQSAFQLAKAPAGIALGASGAINQANKAFAKKGENDTRSFGRRLWDGTKAFGVSAISFGVGMYAGRLGSTAAIETYQEYSGHHDAPAPVTPAQQPVTDMQTQQNLFTNLPDWNSLQNQNSFGFTNMFGDNPFTNNENDLGTTDGTLPTDAVSTEPVIDVNNLSAERLHDLNMLFQREPAEANRLIGDGQWHGSSELEKMWNATGENALSDDVKLKLVQFADARFDEKGHFINSDGSLDTNTENAAKEWQSKHDAAMSEQTVEAKPLRIEPLSPEDMKPKMPYADMEIKMPDPEQMRLDINSGIARGLGVQTIERLDNGNILTDRISPEGRHYTSEISPDAKFVSLTVEGKEFPQEQLDTLNHPEKNTYSSILEQNRQLFMIAPAIGEEARDFTQPVETPEPVANNIPEDIVEEPVLPDSENANANSDTAQTTTDDKTPNSQTTDSVKKPNNPENTVKDEENVSENNLRDTHENSSHKNIDMDIPAQSNHHFAESNDSKDGDDDKDNDAEENPVSENKTQDENSEQTLPPLQQARNDFINELQNNHGLTNIKISSENSSFSEINGHQMTRLAIFCEGSNGYAATSAHGADTFVIHDGEGQFKTGEGETIRPMTYTEAKDFSESVLNNDKTIDGASLQKMTTMSGALYNLDPQAFAKDTALSQGIVVDNSSQIIQKSSGTLIISDNGISFALNDGHVIGCAIDKNGEVKGFNGIYGALAPNNDEQTLASMTKILTSYGHGDSEIGRALGEKTGIDLSSKPEQTAPAHSSADHIKELRGTSPDSATHTTATPKVPTHTGNAQPVKPVSTR